MLQPASCVNGLKACSTCVKTQGVVVTVTEVARCEASDVITAPSTTRCEEAGRGVRIACGGGRREEGSRGR